MTARTWRALGPSAVVLALSGCQPRAPEPAASSAPTTAPPLDAVAPPELTAGAAPSAPDAAPSDVLESTTATDGGTPVPESEDPQGLVNLWTEAGPSDHDASCGSYRIETRVNAKTGLTGVRVVDANGKARLTFQPKGGVESYEPVWCFDATGDGVPELVIDHTSGGAHCCHRHSLFSLTTPPKQLLAYDAGNAGSDLLSPRQIDPGGAFELLDTNDALTQVGSTPYAFTLFLPVIFRYRNGRYEKATRSFPDYLKTEREKALLELHKDCSTDCWEGTWAEYVLGLSLSIGDWDGFKKTQDVPPKQAAELDKLRVKLAPLVR